MKYIVLPFFLLFFLIHSTITAQTSATFTLEDAIHYATENSVTIKNAYLDISDADWRIKENKAIGLPHLDAAINYQYYVVLPASILPAKFFPVQVDSITGDTIPIPKDARKIQFGLKNNLTASLSASQLIFNGSYLEGLKAARLYREYVAQQLEAKKMEVRNNVVGVYLPALLISESSNTLDKNIANLEKLFKEVKELYKAGFAEQLDVDRLDLSLSNLKTERENLDRQMEIVMNALKFTIGYPMDQPISISDNIAKLLSEANSQELEAAINYNDRQEYKVAEIGVALNASNIKINKAAYLPSLALFGSYQYSIQGDNLLKDAFGIPTSVVGVQANIPLFDGFEKKSKIQRAQLQLEMVMNQKKELERAIDLQVLNARIQYKSAKARVESQQKNLALAEKIYNTTLTKFKGGVGSSFELSTAEQGLYQTQQNYTQAQYDLLTAKKNLEKAIGK